MADDAGWTCNLCTLINETEAPVCIVCGTARPVQVGSGPGPVAVAAVAAPAPMQDAAPTPAGATAAVAVASASGTTSWAQASSQRRPQRESGDWRTAGGASSGPRPSSARPGGPKSRVPDWWPSAPATSAAAATRIADGSHVLVIMRGLPGSGKSTFVSNNFPGAVVCSADHYFTRPDGTYVFNVSRLSNAHHESLKKCMIGLMQRAPVVVVDNTNTQLWEYENYVLAGQLAGYEIRIIELECESMDQAYRYNGRGLHDVPDEASASMFNRWQKDPAAIRMVHSSRR